MGEPLRDCGDCGARPGSLHEPGCDVERCPRCGNQLIACPHSLKGGWAAGRLPWTGRWPGDAEAEEFGWYAVRAGAAGWVPCPPGTPGAKPDLMRLAAEARWDAKAGRYVCRSGDAAVRSPGPRCARPARGNR